MPALRVRCGPRNRLNPSAGRNCPEAVRDPRTYRPGEPGQRTASCRCRRRWWECGSGKWGRRGRTPREHTPLLRRAGCGPSMTTEKTDLGMLPGDLAPPASGTVPYLTLQLGERATRRGPAAPGWPRPARRRPRRRAASAICSNGSDLPANSAAGCRDLRRGGGALPRHRGLEYVGARGWGFEIIEGLAMRDDGHHEAAVAVDVVKDLAPPASGTVPYLTLRAFIFGGSNRGSATSSGERAWGAGAPASPRSSGSGSPSGPAAGRDDLQAEGLGRTARRARRPASRGSRAGPAPPIAAMR